MLKGFEGAFGAAGRLLRDGQGIPGCGAFGADGDGGFGGTGGAGVLLLRHELAHALHGADGDAADHAAGHAAHGGVLPASGVLLNLEQSGAIAGLDGSGEALVVGGLAVGAFRGLRGLWGHGAEQESEGFGGERRREPFVAAFELDEAVGDVAAGEVAAEMVDLVVIEVVDAGGHEDAEGDLLGRTGRAETGAAGDDAGDAAVLVGGPGERKACASAEAGA